MKAVQVKVHRRATTAREYDAITVIIGDLHLSCDLVSDRQIRLAKQLADESHAPFVYEAANKKRVESAIGVHPLQSKSLVGQKAEYLTDKLGSHLFELWWAEYVPDLGQLQAWKAFVSANRAFDADEPSTDVLLRKIADLRSQRDGLRLQVAAAIPAMRQFASENKKEYFDDAWQDPCGVHAWLSENGRIN